MPNSAARPDHLPDFQKPPLDEVVLGVQFSPPKGFQQIYCGEVWGLFKHDYPTTQEHPPLMPSFETFGLPSAQSAPPFLIRSFGPGVSPNRFWFLRPDGDELIQFQQDRLLHNWRKVGDRTNEYPRFEAMVERFADELRRLEAYFGTLSPQLLNINQCEVSYINHIELSEDGSMKASDWLRFLNFGATVPDDLSVTLRKVILGKDGKPQGRLICEAGNGVRPDGKQIIGLTLSVRGAPLETTIESALRFIEAGREQIGISFAELTTENAHKVWERIK